MSRIRAALALLCAALWCFLLNVEAQLTLTLSNSNEKLYSARVSQDVLNLGNGTVGAQFEGPVAFLSLADATGFGCNTTKAFLFPKHFYTDKLLIVRTPVAEVLQEACEEGKNDDMFPLATLAVTCALSPLAVVHDRTEDLFRGLHVMNNAESKHVIEANEHLTTCASLRVRESVPDFPNLLNTSNLTGTAKVGVLDMIAFFNSPGPLLTLKGILPAGHFALSLLAAYFLVQRYCRRKINFAYALVLLSSSLSMLVLGVVQVIGAFFLYGYESGIHRNLQLALTTQFFGIGAANDYFSAILYHSIIDSRTRNLGGRTLISRYPKLAILGIFLLVVDVFNAIVIVYSDRKSTAILQALVPSIVLLLQVAVTTFLVVTVRRVIRRLTVAARDVSSASTHGQRLLERRMRFWVKLNCISNVVTVGMSSIVALRVTLTTTTSYFWSIVLLVFSKQVQVLSQIMIARPPPKSGEGNASVTTTKRDKRSSVHPDRSLKNSQLTS